MDNLSWKKAPEVIQSNPAQGWSSNQIRLLSAVFSQVLNISRMDIHQPLWAIGGGVWNTTLWVTKKVVVQTSELFPAQ